MLNVASSNNLFQYSVSAALWRVSLIGMLLLVVGCQAEDVEEAYGHRSGMGARSVNGVAVLANMFEQSGFDVSSWRLLSARLDNEQVIVWAPDSFRIPSREAMDYFESWLTNESGRTLVYVGRDYNGSVDFWEQVIASAPPEQRIELRRKLAELKSNYTMRRIYETLQAYEDEELPWFRYELRDKPDVDASTLGGKWSRGLDTEAVEISLPSKMVIPDDDSDFSFEVEPLLVSEEGVLAASLQKPYWRDSKIILVANGSWLLNLPLVNPEHRVLAQALIDECGPPSRVCILQTGQNAPTVASDSPDQPLMLRAFTVWPVNAILLHATVLGIIFCFAIFPVFGRPRRVEPEAISDFGKHVTAVGELLEGGGDVNYARQRLKVYQEMQHSKQGTES